MIGNAYAAQLWEELIKRGAKPCGLGARDTLRLEAAMPLYGHELSEEIDPFQAGLAWAVKMDKGALPWPRRPGKTPGRQIAADTSRPGVGGQAPGP